MIRMGMGGRGEADTKLCWVYVPLQLSLVAAVGYTSNLRRMPSTLIKSALELAKCTSLHYTDGCFDIRENDTDLHPCFINISISRKPNQR